MATTHFTVPATKWIDLGPSPCDVFLLTGSSVLFSHGDAMPATADGTEAYFPFVRPEDGEPARFPFDNGRVYAWPPTGRGSPPPPAARSE